MKIQKLLILFLCGLFTACSLSTDPSPIDLDISSVPYDNEEHPFTTDSINLYWKCKNNPTKISLFDDSGNLIEEIAPPNSRLESLSDSSWTVGFKGVKPRTYYKWQVIVADTKGTVITGPMWEFQFLPGGSTEGRILKFLEQNVYLPHNIEVAYQVVDLYGKGDTSKTRSHFTITDDDTQPLDEEYVWNVKRLDPPYYSKIILLLDVSYSIKSSPEFIKMKDEAYQFVDKFLPSAPDLTKRIELWKFSDTMEKLVSLTPDKLKLLPVIKSLKDSVLSTDLYGSVIKSVDQYQDLISKNEVIQTLVIVFTDGSDTQGRRTLNEARTSIIDRHIVMVNTDVTETYSYYLNELTNYPKYLDNNHVDVLNFVNDFHINTMLVSKSIYGLYYFSPKRGNKMHDLSIILKNQAYLGHGSIIKTTYSSDGFY